MKSNIMLPPLDPSANKYSRGRLTVIAGSSRYTGAAVLSACAGQRMGAGYTQVVTVPVAVDLVRAASPSLVVCTRSQWNVSQLREFSEDHPGAVCVGPGFEGTDDERVLLLDVLLHAWCPLLIDGGAIGLLRKKKMRCALKRRFENGYATVITPHAGEAARLADGLDIPFEFSGDGACALAKASHAIVVLKGPVTYISDGRSVDVMDQGTPALAKAGTGDVLAGMIASLMAQAIDPFEAAKMGPALHAQAGIKASERFSERCVLAEDVVDCIPLVLAAR